jgi:hypothetical protein
MRLFGRKRSNNEVQERCPQCNEPVPDQAVECMMCGVDLRPLRRTAVASRPGGVRTPADR